MFPKCGPGDIVTLVSVPGIPELLGFEVKLLVCATEDKYLLHLYFG